MPRKKKEQPPPVAPTAQYLLDLLSLASEEEQATFLQQLFPNWEQLVAAVNELSKTLIASTEEMSGITDFYRRTCDQLRGKVEKLKDVLDRRTRKPDPENVRQYLEICERRRSNKRHWTLSKLAELYEKSVARIRAILGDEWKWRQIAGN